MKKIKIYKKIPLFLGFTRTLSGIKTSGFTAIELTVVISIFAILSAIVLFNSNLFNSKIAFENLTSDIAINILQAQKEAVSGKFNSLNFGKSSPSYGIHFDTSSGKDKMFTYFADLPLFAQKGVYEPGSGCGFVPTECLKEIKIETGDHISLLCVNQKSGGYTTCVNPVSDLDIVFTRPFPKPNISSTTLPPLPNNIYDAEITITSAKSGESRTIVVWPTGQISVE